VITSGSNVRQVRTIAEEIELRVKEQGGGSPRYIEGLDGRPLGAVGLRPVRGHVFLAEAGGTTTWNDSGPMRPGGAGRPGGTSRRGRALGSSQQVAKLHDTAQHGHGPVARSLSGTRRSLSRVSRCQPQAG